MILSVSKRRVTNGQIRLAGLSALPKLSELLEGPGLVGQEAKILLLLGPVASLSGFGFLFVKGE